MTSPAPLWRLRRRVSGTAEDANQPGRGDRPFLCRSQLVLAAIVIRPR
jgi:hypothetical protein